MSFIIVSVLLVKDNVYLKDNKIYHYTYFFMFGLYRDIRPFQWSMLKVVYLICIQTMVLDQIIYIYVDDQKLYSFCFVFALEWTIYVNDVRVNMIHTYTLYVSVFERNCLPYTCNLKLMTFSNTLY